MFFFRGFMNSEIYFDSNSSRWRLQSNLDRSKYLLMNTRSRSYLPTGRHTWESMADGAVCEEDQGHQRALTISICKETEFTCDYGNCISIM